VTFRYLVLNGPNLNLLGKREPHLYGHQTLKDIQDNTQLEIDRNQWPVSLDWKQSHMEGELIHWIQDLEVNGYHALIFNPGGYTHTSVSLHDACVAVSLPIVEVHLTNLYKREAIRHQQMVTSSAVTAVFMGASSFVYRTAVYFLLSSMLFKRNE
jgi:3-dehydroquinate dehydratase-2